ncbi:MAG: hypothetical protein JWN70_4599 [Planctomycetaceae bacterium]|nr:hypothetical protein [Planctomycetaceae bacterium]
MWRLLLVLLFVALTASASAQEKVSGWHTDLDSASKLARESGKPLFVVFRCVR